jgi:predicted MPP superfamily phosphohydrolase
MNLQKINRREAVLSLATISAGALARPSSIFCSPAKDKLRFALIGDWGTGDDDQVRIARQMFSAHQQSPLDFVISVGDNIYPNGSGHYFGKHFEVPFASLLKDRVNFYTVLGNHDVRAGRQDQCQYPLFNMGGTPYYRLQRGDGLTEFFMLDSTDFDQRQVAWLENSLRDSKAKWKIAVFHHPIYSSGKMHGSDLRLRKQLESLLAHYGVNIALSGHDHIYERTKPQQGVQYFVSGAGGQVRKGDVDRSSSFRAQSFDEDNHFMLFEINDSQTQFRAVSGTGIVVDSGVLTCA